MRDLLNGSMSLQIVQVLRGGAGPHLEALVPGASGFVEARERRDGAGVVVDADTRVVGGAIVRESVAEAAELHQRPSQHVRIPPPIQQRVLLQVKRATSNGVEAQPISVPAGVLAPCMERSNKFMDCSRSLRGRNTINHCPSRFECSIHGMSSSLPFAAS